MCVRGGVSRCVRGGRTGIVAARPEFACRPLVEVLVSSITGTGLEVSHTSTAPATNDSSLVWYLRLLSGAVRGAGAHLLPLLPAIAHCVRVGLAHPARKAQKRAHKVLRHTLSALTTYYVSDLNSVPVAERSR